MSAIMDVDGAGPNMDFENQLAAGVGLEEIIRQQFVTFLERFGREAAFQSDDGQPDESYYARSVHEMRAAESTTLHVDYVHVLEYDRSLAGYIRSMAYRLEGVLRRALFDFVKVVEPEYQQTDEGVEREFYVSFFNVPVVTRLRDLKVDKVGTLEAFTGTVTRTSEVRPELFLGAFRCLECGTVVRGIEQQFKYTEPLICTNATCGNRRSWTLVREESEFVDWQRVKVQESPDEVPAGSLPRTMDVIMRNAQVEAVKAGDKVTFTGTLIVVPDVGALSAPGQVAVKTGGMKGSGSDGFSMKSMGTREMTYRLMFIATAAQAADIKAGQVNIRDDKDLTPDMVLAEFGEREAAQVVTMSKDQQIYSKLTRSMCPSVWGHDSIKQAVLLMLFGGVHKQTKEGINLRGDINVAIVGDPSCAKSQILKYVANFLPRAVYTSGKASTAAGLTASVVKEPENNEFAIEAGALMLADNGICCIDEFDKMDVKDQVAIHEAMEQQTISITKAGIQATLNARASILAAANPVGGRYDKSKPLKYNVALPPALLSRFDLMHVMLDETTETTDMRIAEHIINVHRFQATAFHGVPYNTEQLQRYIKYARAIKPELTPEAGERLVTAYKQLRADDAAPGTQSSYRITVRQLEALVRLSEAMARVYCCQQVKPEHVDEAKKLLKASILKIEQSDLELEDILPLPNIQPEDLPNVAPENQEQKEGEPSGDGSEPAAKRARTEAGAQDGEQAAQEQQPAEKKTVKITAQKFNFMKNMLVKKVLEASDAFTRAGEDGGDSDDTRGDGSIRQGDLMSWYLERQIAKGILKSTEDAEGEMQLLYKVVNRLLGKECVLAVVTKPEREAAEDERAYWERVQNDRTLTLHSNFSPDA